MLFDGKPIDRIDRSVFTGSLAVVDQEIVLFEDTIEDNIKMWNRSIEDFEMILAARDARIYDAVIARQGGFGGKLAEHGRKIYEVTFYKDGYEYEYDIDAESGKVLKFEKELDD